MQFAFQQARPRADLSIFCAAASLLLLMAVSGCAGLTLSEQVDALRITDVMNEGDATRRASQRLLIEGLRADAAGAASAAKGKYERALQLDATNPYAYLVFARFELDRRNRDQAHAFLERAASLFDGEGSRSPRVEPHLLGMRGVIDGRGSGALEDARRMSPSVWGDGYLSAEELL